MKTMTLVGLVVLALAACRREVPYESVYETDYDRYYNGGDTYYPPQRYPIK